MFIDVFSRKFDGIHECLNSGNREPKQAKKKNLLIFFDEFSVEEPTKVEPVEQSKKVEPTKAEPIKEIPRVTEISSVDQSKRERRNSKIITKEEQNAVNPQTENSSEMMISFDFFGKPETQTNLNNFPSPKSGVISPNSGAISPNSMGSFGSGKMKSRSNSMIPNKNPMMSNSMGQNRTMNPSNVPFDFGSQYTLPTMVFQTATPTPVQTPNPQVLSPKQNFPVKKEPENTQKKEKDPFSDLFWK
jgi:hypothetical protein